MVRHTNLSVIRSLQWLDTQIRQLCTVYSGKTQQPFGHAQFTVWDTQTFQSCTVYSGQTHRPFRHTQFIVVRHTNPPVIHSLQWLDTQTLSSYTVAVARHTNPPVMHNLQWLDTPNHQSYTVYSGKTHQTASHTHFIVVRHLWHYTLTSNLNLLDNLFRLFIFVEHTGLKTPTN